MKYDTVTTVLGIATSTSALAAQQGLFPHWTGPIAAVLGSLFAYYTNHQSASSVK